MKSKLLSGLLLVVALFMITGCDNKPNNTNGNTNTEKKDTSSLKIGTVSVDLNRSGSFHDTSYKYPENAMASNVGTFAIMDLMNGEDLVVRIALYFFENKTIGEVNPGSGLSSVDAIEYNNNTWNVYEGIKDGKKLINYATQEGDDSYTITFISNDDAFEFSDAFMKTVEFNR